LDTLSITASAAFWSSCHQYHRRQQVADPLPFVPIIGGLTGLAFAILLGWVSTQRSGTAFAMISLGVAELVASSALILRTFFGGEAGISANRTKLLKFFDWNFGPQIQIYYLVAAWTLICMIAMYALTRTPLGRMCNAVRDNPERVQFVGYDPHVVRYIAFCFSGFFAGIAARWPPSTSRSRTRPISARCSPARCCSRPISAASASSSDRWSARSSSPSCRWA
jgi:ABC-type branched-subunit amino acid transport system permease subunit